MKVISTGRIFRITDDSLKTYNQIPAAVYTVRFNKQSGFFLEEHDAMEVKEEKIYGVHDAKVTKVLTAFDDFNRSLGVILSGDKGIGKSLFARLLSIRAVEQNMPLIIVEDYIPGIASFLEEIKQEVVVLFDEFDKTFASSSNGDHNPQVELLSLLDGVSQGKKLYVITCNELMKLNEFLVNRPGRFHYHFRFEYPSAEEVREYLTDKLDEVYYDQIDDVIAFSRKVNLNFDCLRAIVFELNNGISFKEAIKDLNIMNVDIEKYDITLHFTNAKSIIVRNRSLDMFNDEELEIDFYTEETSYCISAIFSANNAEYNMLKGGMILSKDKFRLDYDTEYSDDVVNKSKSFIPDSITIKRKPTKNLHYAV